MFENSIIHKTSLGSRDVPQKIWAVWTIKIYFILTKCMGFWVRAMIENKYLN